jgi:hypothetical protein
VDDANCQLVDISTVFDSQNIWQDVQIEGKSSGISWKFSSGKCWKSFFTNKFADSKRKEDWTAELEVTKASEKRVAQFVQTCIAAVDNEVQWNEELGKKLRKVLVEWRKEGATAETNRKTVHKLTSEHKAGELSGRNHQSLSRHRHSREQAPRSTGKASQTAT